MEDIERNECGIVPATTSTIKIRSDWERGCSEEKRSDLHICQKVLT